MELKEQALEKRLAGFETELSATHAYAKGRREMTLMEWEADRASLLSQLALRESDAEEALAGTRTEAERALVEECALTAERERRADLDTTRAQGTGERAREELE